MVHQLRFCAPNAGGPRFNPWSENSIPHARTKIPRSPINITKKKKKLQKSKQYGCAYSLVVHWLETHTFTAKGANSIPGWKTNILQVVRQSKKKTQINKIEDYSSDIGQTERPME